MRLREVVSLAVRGAVALGAAVAVFYASVILFFAVVVAREESRWREIYVYEYGDSEFWRSDSGLIDIYAQPPLNVSGWMGLSAFVVAAWAIAVGGLWLIAWMIAGVRRTNASREWFLRPTRIAVPVLLWGIVVLSAYALAIFLWNWVEWKHLLDEGLTLEGDPKPEPNPAFDPSQIPLGIVAFGMIAAIALVAVRLLARRRRRQGTSAPRQP